MEKKRNLIINQIELMDDVRSDAKINIVTCGNCGTVLLHKLSDEQIHCFDCDRVLDVSDCPDLYYVGIENNQEYNPS